MKTWFRNFRRWLALRKELQKGSGVIVLPKNSQITLHLHGGGGAGSDARLSKIEVVEGTKNDSDKP